MNVRYLARRQRRISATPQAGGRRPSFAALLAAAYAIPLEPESAQVATKGAGGLTAQYATLGGHVRVSKRSGFYGWTEPTETHAECSACGESKTFDWGWSPWAHQAEQPQDDFDEGGKRSAPQAREWALDHALECTAVRSST